MPRALSIPLQAISPARRNEQRSTDQEPTKKALVVSLRLIRNLR